MPEPLTPIERKIYQFLVDHLKEETFQPSIREIGKKFGIRSTKTVAEHLESLERKGCIERIPSRSRGVRILGVDLSPRTYSVRMYRQVAHGNPGIDEAEGAFELDRSLAGSPDSFLVQVRDADSGCPGVLAGDYLLVEPAATFLEGQWVAHGVGERVRVARWPGSPAHPAIGVSNGPVLRDGVHVLGRVRAVVRRFELPA